MRLLDRLRHLLERAQGRPDPEALLREEALRHCLHDRCRSFRSLLAANRRALEAMSEMESRLAGVQPFGMAVMHDMSERVTSAVFCMVRELNALSDNAYASLNPVFERIRDAMADLQRTRPRARGPLVLPLSAIDLADAPQVGVKMANLGEAAAHVGLAVPDGFAVSASGYDYFMEYGGLRENLERHIQATDMDNLEDLFNLSAVLQREVLTAQLPPDLEHAIVDSVETMRERAGSGLSLAIRSSAVGEDSPGVSFAGQYRSELHVLPEEACQVYKEIVASKYAVTAMSYRYQHGIPDDEAPMCVGVMAMVPSAAGGVAYSRNPVGAAGGRQVLLNAVRGLARGVVEGIVTPDVFVFSHTTPPCLLDRRAGSEASSITDEQAALLARVVLALEEYYNEPQDVEWALDATTGQMVLLQCRPLTWADAASEPAAALSGCDADGLAVPDETVGGGSILASGGMAVSPGIGMGPAFVARKEADILSFPQGGILVVNRALPRWAPLLSRASGIISETGGMAGHLASVAREYRLPALFGLAGACDLLENVGDITLDAGRCAVFAGMQVRLAESATAAQPNLMAGSIMHKRLAALTRLVVPLHLLDPESSQFNPQQCQTLHDITRFCHEKAAEILFEADPLSRSMGKQLKAGSKLQYWIIDIGGGFCREVSGREVDIKEIASAPMLALWDGMVAVPWSGPPAASASSFMAVMLQSAMNPELESTSPSTMTEKNFFIISNNYMLFQGRYGYHLCTVESFAGNSSHESFVNFQFKGGAADKHRRQLRASMVATLLEAHGFRAEVKNDGLFAVAEDFPAREILLKTRLLGYLLIHTRQADMIMLEADRAAALQRKLAADMEALCAQPVPASLEAFLSRGCP